LRATGKRANGQTLISLTLAGEAVPIPVRLRLFLLKEWTDDPKRSAETGVPNADIIHRRGMRFGIVLADAGYGVNAAFRCGLDAQGQLRTVAFLAIRKSMAWMSS